MSTQEAQNLIDQFRASTERTLGTGNLALGNMNAENTYNLGVGRLGLDRDRLLYDISQGDTQSLIDLINQLTNAAGISAGGYA